jgi:hypothetical protein
MSDPAGATLPQNFCPVQDFFKPARKQLHAPPENKKIVVAFLKAA